MITERELDIKASEISVKTSPASILILTVSVSFYLLNIAAYHYKTYGYLSAITVGAVCSYFMFAMMHDSLHGALLPKDKKLNNFIGVILGITQNTHFESFKKRHNQHHLYANSNRDPDLIFAQQGKYSHIFIVPFFIACLKLILALPKFIKTKIFKLIKGKPGAFLYLGNKDKAQVNLYRFTFIFSVTSMLLFGIDSIIPMLYSCSFLSIFIYNFMANWLPHETLFDRKEESVNKYKTAKSYSFPLSGLLMWGVDKHIIHHLYPQIQTANLRKFYLYAKPLIDKESLR
jgi:fatty acid desaturase